MNPEDLEKFSKYVSFGLTVFAEAQKILQNYQMQAGKSEDEVLEDAETKRQAAMEIINSL